MNVGDLISELQHFDPRLEVQTEGCDCFGDVDHVDLGRGFLSRDVVFLFRDEDTQPPVPVKKLSIDLKEV